MATDGLGSIWLVNADGSDRRQLPDLPHSQSLNPSWSLDGTQIAFTRYYFNTNTVDIYVMNSDGGGARRVARNGFGPRWSPNGKRIAFDHSTCDKCPVTAYVVNADGSDPHRLAPLGRDPVWSPDGKKLAIAGARIWLVDTARGTYRGIPITALDVAGVAWSPDGSQIAISGAVNEGVWVVNADGSGFRRLTPASLDVAGLSWSPDGRQIAVGGGAHEGMWVVDADGSGLRRLTRPSGDMADTSPAWSPDGKSILFLRGNTYGCGTPGDPTNPNIYVVHKDGSGLHRLPLDHGCVDSFASQPPG